MRAEKEELSKKYIELRTKTLKVTTEMGDLTPDEIKQHNLPYGTYYGTDDVIGITMCHHLPRLAGDMSNLYFALSNINEYKHLADKYHHLIKTDPIVKWSLIPFLIMCQDIKNNLPQFRPIPDWTTNELLANHELFHSLAKNGAEYKHFMAYGYQAVRPRYLQIMLNIFGKDATKFPGPSTFITLHLTSFYDEYAFTKVKFLLDAGADINERIDKKFNNTILHYLIALEDQARVLELIKFSENLQNPSENQVNTIQVNYALTDNQGKTALYLAVGLGLEKVVDKLLQLVRNKKYDVGINTQDQFGRTPIMIAAALGYKTLVEQLVIHGADLLIKDKNSNDLMWYANAPSDTVKEILEFVSVNPDRSILADTHSYLYAPTKDSCPLVLVDHQGKEHTLLLSKKAHHYQLLQHAHKIAENFVDKKTVNAIEKQLSNFKYSQNDKTVLEACVENHLSCYPFIKESVLRIHCAIGDLETVKKLIAEGANINSADYLGRTALHYAVMRKELVHTFLESQSGSYTIEQCLTNHLPIFQFLITNGADLEKQNVNKNSPLAILQRDSFSEYTETSQYAKTMLKLVQEFRENDTERSHVSKDYNL